MQGNLPFDRDLPAVSGWRAAKDALNAAVWSSGRANLSDRSFYARDEAVPMAEKSRNNVFLDDRHEHHLGVFWQIGMIQRQRSAIFVASELLAFRR